MKHRDEPTFTSYYGRPILKAPTWEAADIAGYLFLGGLAGASSILGAGASLTDRPALERGAKLAALGAISASAAALVHDLGKPSRFYNMLRVAKPTSPMSVGSWLLAGYGPLAGVSALAVTTGTFSRLGRAAGFGAAVLGAGVASYTSVLIADTAVPAWHEARRQLPFIFVGSAAAAAGGLAMAAIPTDQAAPARRIAVAGAALELIASRTMEHSAGLAEETYSSGRAGALLRAAKTATALGAAGTVLAGRHRPVAILAGTALVAGSALTRFGLFAAGRASTLDPKYVVVPQRERLATEGSLQ
jgi:formate-dependent nitrite reductase membrane component NrfD